MAISSLSRTTPASSAVAALARTRGSSGTGSVATIGRSWAAPILQPQPAPWESEVRGTVIRVCCPRWRSVTRKSKQRSGASRRRGGSTPPSAPSPPRRPALQRILNQALEDADWFGSAHAEAVRKAAGSEDVETAVRTLVAEETRVAMLIGAAVGLELANQLQNPTED